MILSTQEFQSLVSAFQYMLDSFPLDSESDLLYQQTEDFLARFDFQADYHPTDGELQNCIMALQMICANTPAASPAHRALLGRFLALQFRSF